jgi:hypothetical protein
VIDAVAALEFLWSGQDGLFELARKSEGRDHRQLYPRDEALSSLAGYDYFGPLARRSYGSSDDNVAGVGNVLWADIDNADRIDDRLIRVPVAPSLVIHSGNTGFWAYWKLTRSISAAEIESLNRGLSNRLEADRGSWRRTQLARLPGSFREETGRRAEVVEFGSAAYDPDRLSSVKKRRLLRFH